MIDSSEKYLFEYDNINPFYALLFEGFFGFLLSIAYDLYYNPFDNISEFKKNKSYSEFDILILCLIIYIILSSLKNLFRVNTTKISNFKYSDTFIENLFFKIVLEKIMLSFILLENFENFLEWEEYLI